MIYNYNICINDSTFKRHRNKDDDTIHLNYTNNQSKTNMKFSSKKLYDSKSNHHLMNLNLHNMFLNDNPKKTILLMFSIDENVFITLDSKFNLKINDMMKILLFQQYPIHKRSEKSTLENISNKLSIYEKTDLLNHQKILILKNLLSNYKDYVKNSLYRNLNTSINELKKLIRNQFNFSENNKDFEEKIIEDLYIFLSSKEISSDLNEYFENINSPLKFVEMVKLINSKLELIKEICYKNIHKALEIIREIILVINSMFNNELYHSSSNFFTNLPCEIMNYISVFTLTLEDYQVKYNNYISFLFKVFTSKKFKYNKEFDENLKDKISWNLSENYFDIELVEEFLSDYQLLRLEGLIDEKLEVYNAFCLPYIKSEIENLENYLNLENDIKSCFGDDFFLKFGEILMKNNSKQSQGCKFPSLKQIIDKIQNELPNVNYESKKQYNHSSVDINSEVISLEYLISISKFDYKFDHNTILILRHKLSEDFTHFFIVDSNNQIIYIKLKSSILRFEEFNNILYEGNNMTRIFKHQKNKIVDLIMINQHLIVLYQNLGFELSIYEMKSLEDDGKFKCILEDKIIKLDRLTSKNIKVDGFTNDSLLYLIEFGKNSFAVTDNKLSLNYTIESLS